MNVMERVRDIANQANGKLWIAVDAHKKTRADLERALEEAGRAQRALASIRLEDDEDAAYTVRRADELAVDGNRALWPAREEVGQ